MARMRDSEGKAKRCLWPDRERAHCQKLQTFCESQPPITGIGIRVARLGLGWRGQPNQGRSNIEYFSNPLYTQTPNPVLSWPSFGSLPI